MSAPTEEPEVYFPQTHDEVILDSPWWWSVYVVLCFITIVGNLLFLVTVVFHRKRPEVKTFVTAVLITVAVLDIVDVLRVTPVLWKTLFLEQIFRHVYCTFGIFHELAIAMFLVSLSIAIAVQAGKETKYFASAEASLTQKILIPLLVLIAAGTAAPFFLFSYERLTHTCTDPFRVMFVADGPDSTTFEADLYSTVVTVVTYLIPVVVIPISIPIAAARTCIARQCCVPRFKQPIGEIIMVSLMTLIYFATVVGVMLPRIDKMMNLEDVNLGPAPLLWELANNAARPLIIFMTNPAIWDGLRHLCCRNKHEAVSTEDDEIEVPLSPVTSV